MTNKEMEELLHKAIFKLTGDADKDNWRRWAEEQELRDKLTLVDDNQMLWVNGEHFRCSCRCNVFSEYKTGDGKRIFECHACGSKYEGE